MEVHSTDSVSGQETTSTPDEDRMEEDGDAESEV